MHSHLITSREVQTCRKITAVTVNMLKGATLKEMVETTRYGKELCFYSQIPQTFG